MNDPVAMVKRDEGGFGAAVAMVTAGIKHHVEEEETELFPKLKENLPGTSSPNSATRSPARRKPEASGMR